MATSKIWREPLLHFVLLGSAIFGVEQLSREDDDGIDPIVVSDDFIDALEREEAQRGNASARVQRASLVARFVREEALFREANRLGLDRGDVIVRRRLIQKMEFLLRSAARPPEPLEQELQAYLDAHGSAFERPAELSFTHVFFEDLARARAMEPLADDQVRADDVGDPFLLGYALSSKSRSWIAGRFGEGFAEAVDQAPEGRWIGPIRSAFGSHWVRVGARTAARPAELDEVRERVARALAREREDAAFERALARLVEQHPVQRVQGPS